MLVKGYAAGIYDRGSVIRLVFTVLLGGGCLAGAQVVAPPPDGKLYQGCYFDEPSRGHDPTEHDVTAADVLRLEKTLETETSWVFFSNNWSESRRFPLETCRWVRALGKVPYIRLMLRSDLEQDHAEKLFTLSRIVEGTFDNDLKKWANDAKAFGSPILIEWGTEPNGRWFSWNGEWNGGAGEGPRRYVAAYRHIIDLMRGEDARNLTWVWHVNWFDVPETAWNRFENYYPGADYCDWVALSVYGPLTPTARSGTGSFRSKVDLAYPRLRKLAPGKPVVIAEFGCDIHNPKVDACEWAKGALEDLFSGRWPAVIGFCWWNESWENDDVRQHDTDMIILHDQGLLKVFREELKRHQKTLEGRARIECLLKKRRFAIADCRKAGGSNLVQKWRRNSWRAE